MEKLPPELVLYIFTFLQTDDLVRLQQVSKGVRSIAREEHLWKRLCYKTSKFESLRLRRQLLFGDHTTRSSTVLQQAASHLTALQAAQENSHDADHDGLPSNSFILSSENNKSSGSDRRENHERLRALANWDPTYPSEKIDWYQEYIHRNAPIHLKWLKQPSGSSEKYTQECRGLALFEDDQNIRMVSPVDDGSICIWDLNDPQTNSTSLRGRILARSEPNTLSEGRLSPSSMRWAKTAGSTVSECISVDNTLKRAYVAVKSTLREVDLQTLRTVSSQTFPFPISALSELRRPDPMTVGTNLSIHLHDPRVHQKSEENNISIYQCEQIPIRNGSNESCYLFQNTVRQEPPILYALLSQPGPSSILHLPEPGQPEHSATSSIFVAGRFSGILNYDRRQFPKLLGSIFSGSRLSSLTSLPYCHTALDAELMRRNELSLEAARAAHRAPGSTLIAAGEYNGRGSLELYGLRTPSDGDSNTAGRLQSSTYKNRYTAGKAKLLSLVHHGTRLAYSDGDGMVRWVERDGSTEVRAFNLNADAMPERRGLFASRANEALDSGMGDVARKLLAIPGSRHDEFNTDDILVWTGEKIGLLSWNGHANVEIADQPKGFRTKDEELRVREERVYSRVMREALERSADEARFMQGLGLRPRFP